VILLLWQAASFLQLLPSALFPAPVDVAVAWWSWLTAEGSGRYDGTWLGDALLTGSRVLIGFAIAAVTGVILGILMGYFRLMFTVLDPLVQLFRPIPAVAWVPLSVVLFGFSQNASIFLIAYGAFFPIVVNTVAGVLRSERSFLLVGNMLGASRLQMLRYVVVPAAMPSIFTGLRLGIGTAWILAIVGEMVAVRSGLGYSLLNAYSVFRYDIIIAAMASFGILGLLSDRIVVLAERRILRWRAGYDVASG
jgi:NitT/TauT family transport system permease protein